MRFDLESTSLPRLRVRVFKGRIQPESQHAAYKENSIQKIQTRSFLQDVTFAYLDNDCLLFPSGVGSLCLETGLHEVC